MCAVVLKARGEFAGEGGFFVLDRIGELALRYAFHKRFWGQGLASEAAHSVIDHGFRRLGLERIERLPKVELHVYAVTPEKWFSHRT
jgi:RimJ/RimL family protein N-acetyltransferase